MLRSSSRFKRLPRVQRPKQKCEPTARDQSAEIRPPADIAPAKRRYSTASQIETHLQQGDHAYARLSRNKPNWPATGNGNLILVHPSNVSLQRISNPNEGILDQSAARGDGTRST